jgi:hypothetical protein
MKATSSIGGSPLTPNPYRMTARKAGSCSESQGIITKDNVSIDVSAMAKNTCWRCGAVWVDRDAHDDEPSGRSGIARFDSDDAAGIPAAAPDARDAVLSGRA